MTEKQRQLITRKLEKLREARILATDASVQFKLDNEIEALEAQLAGSEGKASSQANASRPTTKPKDKRNILALIAVIIAAIVLLFGNNIMGRLFGGNTSVNTPHTLTIKVRDAENKRPLKSAGKLVIDYNNVTDERQINEQGNVDIRGIASDIGKPLKIQLEAKGYKALYPDNNYTITKDAINFLVETSCDACRIFGTVRQQDRFVEGAIVQISGFQIADTTDVKGFFELQIPPQKEQAEYAVTVLQNDKIVWDNYITPTSNIAAEILLKD